LDHRVEKTSVMTTEQNHRPTLGHLPTTLIQVKMSVYVTKVTLTLGSLYAYAICTEYPNIYIIWILKCLKYLVFVLKAKFRIQIL
jgi:hypothetical protein